jgi:hypothetical protein
MYVRQLLYNNPKVNITNPLQIPNFSGEHTSPSPTVAETPDSFKATGSRFNERARVRKPFYKPRTSLYEGVPESVLRARGLDVTFPEVNSEPIVAVDFVLDRLMGNRKELKGMEEIEER